MADIREKMIELLRKTRYEYRHYISVKDYEKRIAKTEEEFLAIDDSIVGEIPFCADYLLSNGVTIATDNNVGHKWIPVTERLPKENEYVLILCRGDRQVARIEKGITKEERSAMKRGELPDPVVMGWTLVDGWRGSKRSSCYYGCDEDGNNAVPYCWKANGGPMEWFGQDVTHWMPLPEQPKKAQ